MLPNGSDALGEKLLAESLDAVPVNADESRIPEAAMPAGLSKCDYLVECGDALVGLEFTDTAEAVLIRNAGA